MKPLGPNFPLAAALALFPLLLGFIWYNPKVFGKAWMKGAGLNEESMKGANMILIFGLTYVFSFFLAVTLHFVTIHQFGLYSLIANIPNATDINTTAGKWYADSMGAYGHAFRTYKHGALHGTIFAVTAILPVIAVNGLFERRGFAYIMINWGFWAVCCIVMGAIICHWA